MGSLVNSGYRSICRTSVGIGNIHKYKKCPEHHIDSEELTAIAAETRLEVLRRAPMDAAMEKYIVVENRNRIVKNL